MATDQRTLYRLPEHGVIAGVAAGFADYFNVDVTVMRLLFIIAAVLSGGGAVIAYLILAVVMPTPQTDRAKTAAAETDNPTESNVKSDSKLSQYLGGALIIAGAWMLLAILAPHWLAIQWKFLWPILLIGLGILIVTRSRR